MQAATFKLIKKVFGSWPPTLIEALQHFHEKRIEPKDWAAEYERMEAERKRRAVLYQKWAEEDEEAQDAYTEWRHEEFERLVAAKGKHAAFLAWTLDHRPDDNRELT